MTHNPSYSVRKALHDDLDIIMDIIDEARQTMRLAGNNNQWINGYPSSDLITNDIAQGYGFVVANGVMPIAYFAFIASPEPTYAIIDGQWIDDTQPYHVLHRIGSRQAAHGVMRTIIDHCLTIDSNLRIDTHRDNAIMHHLLPRYGFQRCGIVHLSDGSERVAYQMIK